MKKIILVALFCGFVFSVFSQTYSWKYDGSTNSSGNYYTRNIDILKNGSSIGSGQLQYSYQSNGFVNLYVKTDAGKDIFSYYPGSNKISWATLSKDYSVYSETEAFSKCIDLTIDRVTKSQLIKGTSSSSSSNTSNSSSSNNTSSFDPNFTPGTQFNSSKTYGTFKDARDGKTYKTIKIGTQTWFAENLAYKPNSGNYWSYDNNSSNVAKFGYLYNWVTAKQVCPAGWHLPSDAEWTTLTNYLGGETYAGNKVKSEIGFKPNQKCNSTNESGFSALSAGRRYYYDGSFNDLGSYSYFWSSTPYESENAWIRFLSDSNTQVLNMNDNRAIGFSVRCVKD